MNSRLNETDSGNIVKTAMNDVNISTTQKNHTNDASTFNLDALDLTTKKHDNPTISKDCLNNLRATGDTATNQKSIDTDANHLKLTNKDENVANGCSPLSGGAADTAIPIKTAAATPKKPKSKMTKKKDKDPAEPKK